MSPVRYRWLVCLACFACPLAWAFGQPVAQPPASVAARDKLDEAIFNLGNLEWIRTDLAIEINAYGVKAEGTGQFIVAPNQRRVLMQMNLKAAGVRGESRLVSDGNAIWRVEQFGGEKIVQSYAWAEIDRLVPSGTRDEALRRVRKELEADHGLAGVRPMLEDLKQRVQFTSMEKAELPGAAGRARIVTLKLKGEWTESVRKTLTVPDKSGAKPGDQPVFPAFVPRQCELYLGWDPAVQPWTLWPYRLEWYGPTKHGGKKEDDERLLTYEFRNPSFLPPASQMEVEQLFSAAVTGLERKEAKPLSAAALIEKRRDTWKNILLGDR